MLSYVERRSRRWLLRRLDRQERRRQGTPPRPAPRVVAAASVVDGYCDALGPAVNDDGETGGGRRGGPPLAIVRP